MARREDDQRRIEELEDKLKDREERIAELRDEVDELRDLVTRLREQGEDYHSSIESWCEAFGMEMKEDGLWTWKPFWNEHDALLAKYNALVRDWNAAVPILNHRQRNVGRPLAASEAQVAEVRRLRKAGRSLRGIVEDTNLGLPTVRTIVGQMDGRDRTSQKHRGRLERIEISREQRAEWKRQRRTGAALPKRVNAFLKDGHALSKEARGLGR
jgi:DNA repair exonuclease SbcCD ATPase subunit